MSDDGTFDEVKDEGIDKIIGSASAIMLQLIKLVDDLEQVMGPLQLGFHSLQLEKLLRLKRTLMMLKDAGKSLEKFDNTYGETVCRIANEIMSDREMDEIRLDGYKFTPGTADKFNINKADKTAFIEWMKEHDEGCELVQEDVHSKTRDSFLKGLLEDGQALPEFVNHYPRPTINVRKLPRRS